MCGKNFKYVNNGLVSPGSPPRVREKHVVTNSGLSTGGITPACAGKTPFGLSYITITQDHPRVCGKNRSAYVKSRIGSGSPPRVREKPPKRLSTTIREGSPPRVREKPQLGFACWCVPGITPACAGKTYIRQVSSGVVWDHPRVCGKN